MRLLLIFAAGVVLAAVVTGADPAAPNAATGSGDAAAILARAVAAGEILPADLARLIALDAAPSIFDVRSDREWREGRVPGAAHVPFAQVGDRLAEVPRRAGTPVVVYCAHGPRAWVARWTLRKHLAEPVITLAGHWSRWAKERHPVER